MATPPEKITVHAPAKLNLILEVVGRREDGYHDLRSLFAPVSLSDRIALERRPAGEGIIGVLVAGYAFFAGKPDGLTVPWSDEIGIIISLGAFILLGWFLILRVLRKN